jgi:hypothetical protein
MSKILDDIASTYSQLSDKTSTAIRALALGILAVSWLAATGGEKTGVLTDSLPRAGALVWAALAAGVLALSFDVLQYAITTLMFGRYFDAVEFLFEKYGKDFSSRREKRLWKRVNKYGLVSLVVQSATELDPQVLSSDDAKAKASEVLENLRRYRNGLPPKSSSVSDQKLIELESKLETPYRSSAVIAVSRYMFSFKILLTAIAGACLVIYLIGAGASAGSDNDRTCSAWATTKKDLGAVPALPTGSVFGQPGINELAQSRAARLAGLLDWFDSKIVPGPVNAYAAGHFYVDEARIEVKRLTDHKYLEPAEAASIQAAESALDSACRRP